MTRMDDLAWTGMACCCSVTATPAEHATVFMPFKTPVDVAARQRFSWLWTSRTVDLMPRCVLHYLGASFPSSAHAASCSVGHISNIGTFCHKTMPLPAASPHLPHAHHTTHLPRPL